MHSTNSGSDEGDEATARQQRSASPVSRSPSPLPKALSNKRRRIIIDSDDDEPAAPPVPPNTPVVQHEQVAYLFAILT